MDKSKLEEFNHWWIKGRVDPDLALPFKREIYPRIENSLDKRFILALTGLRRIGKTTIMYQIIEKLIKENVPVEEILFFSFDEINVKLSDVLEAYKDLHKKEFREKRIYIFLDEIQKCENWENELKKYYDLYPKLKFIITGSESLFIKKKSKENLAGRILEFVLSPFTFREYLIFNNIKEGDFKYETKIKPFFIAYAKNGGFPETFDFKDKRILMEYLRAIVVDKIVFKDAPKLFKIEDPEFLRILLELIATNPGMYIDYQSLGKQFEKDRRLIKNYLIYLKESFLINILGNYRKGSITTLRKKKKVYPSDNGLIALYKQNVDGIFFSKMVETLIVNNIKAVNFWKNGNEVDIVHEGIPIEVKYQENINSEDFKPLRGFMAKFGRKQAVMITKNKEGQMEFEEGTIKLIPAWKWLLEKDALERFG